MLLACFLSFVTFALPFECDGASVARPAQVAAELYADKALEHFHSLEFEEAQRLYATALEIEHDNAEWWVGLAHVRMFQHLRSAGRLDAQMYGASNGLIPEPPPADPQYEREMWAALKRARELCEKRLAANADDTEAHYALGLAYAVESNFHLNARRKPLDALAPATKAKDHHLRVRSLDPANHDANFVIGTYQYAIGSVPAAFRWILRMIGHSGSKHDGIELMHDAMLNGKRIVPSVLVTLAYVYAREKQHAASRQMLEHLARFYPRSVLFPMEIAASYARDGNPAAAAQAYEEIVRKFESGAPGYHRLDASRLYFQTAVMHEHAKQYQQAAVTYDKALTAIESASSPLPRAGCARGSRASPPSKFARLHAHVLLRLGHISATLGQEEKARTLLERAAASPFREVQRAAKSKLKSLSPR
ncbi:MAG: tetratricopeptide repeat protein [Candidatus Acidiferrales bacterium]